VLGLAALVRASLRIPRREFDVVEGFGRTLGHDVFRAGGGAHAAWLAVRTGLEGSHLAVAKAPRDAFERWLDRRAVTEARRVIANSEMAANDLQICYGVGADRIRVVRNGVDADRFRPDPDRRAKGRARIGVPEGGRVAMFVGHAYRRKGLATAVEAFARVAKPADRFVVLGHDAHAERHLTPMRATLGPRLVALGPTDAPEDWYPAADATLLPTWYDSAANTTIEAMACGVPAITSTRDGNAPGDSAGFARALTSAWEGRFGEAVRTIALRWPDVRNTEATENVFHEMLQ
jgi:UDP-glucose:(heptosyl)LPS alpha-1,3-glucosyltransferase